MIEGSDIRVLPEASFGLRFSPPHSRSPRRMSQFLKNKSYEPGVMVSFPKSVLWKIELVETRKLMLGHWLPAYVQKICEMLDDSVHAYGNIISPLSLNHRY